MNTNGKRVVAILSGIILSIFAAVVVLSSFLSSADAVALSSDTATPSRPAYPTGVAVSADGKTAFISSKEHKSLLVIDIATGAKLSEFPLEFPATGVVLAKDGKTAYVTASYDKGFLYKIDLATGAVVKSVETGMGACAPTLSADEETVFVCNQYQATVSKVSTDDFTVAGVVKVLREPSASVLSKDEKFLFVNNHLPAQRADVDYVAADVTVISTKTMDTVKNIKLDNGSNALRGITITPDGKYILVTHNLGRFQVPTSQLQQGWMNTNAVSIIDIAGLKFMGAVLLDEPERGAAGVWGVKCSDNDIVISHSGTHDVSIVDYGKFIERFIAYPDKPKLSYDLIFMYDIRKRIPVSGNGPRDIAVMGDKVYVPTYFSDSLTVIDIPSRGVVGAVSFNPTRMVADEDRGEQFFNDASYCFQNWQSCNGCHPGDARTDAMNWDLMNDDIGNPKNCKSMLFSHKTPPNMISGIRAAAEVAVRAGFKYIQFANIPEEFAVMVDKYLIALEPLPSPYLVNGNLSEKAKRGREVFERMRCDECHSGPYFTDMKMHRIGEDIEFERGWDTPALREVWRTAPYLFDGRAATMEEVFTVHKHGINGKLSTKDAEALSEYVNSL